MTLRDSLLLTLLLAGCAARAPFGTTSPSAPARMDRHSDGLVGTWRAIQYRTWDREGRVSTPFGDPVSGYAVFDPTGHAFVQLMRMPTVPPFADPGAPTPEEIRTAFSAFAAYYGTYTVDDAARTVTIRVEGSNMPSYTGSEQVRPFRIQGDTLTLGVPDQYQATLVRVR